MSRISSLFEGLRKRGEKALVSYAMVGYPDYETSLKVFETLLEAGSDLLEVGFPFSDPVADGTTIQKAHEEALRRGVKLKHLWETLKYLRERFPEKPLLVMTYYNPVFKKGLEEFSELLKEAGGDGLIVPDLPPEEAAPLKEALKERGLSFVPLASPTSTEKRLRLICESADGMVYFVSLLGTTGAREELPYRRVREKVLLYKSFCQKPAVVGFGVSKGEHVRELCSFAEGVVVGSALVKLAGEGKLKELRKLVEELKEATRET